MKRSIIIGFLLLCVKITFAQTMCVPVLQVNGSNADCISTESDISWVMTNERTKHSVSQQECSDWYSWGDGSTFTLNLQELETLGAFNPGDVFTLKIKVESSTCLVGYSGTATYTWLGGGFVQTAGDPDGYAFIALKGVETTLAVTGTTLCEGESGKTVTLAITNLPTGFPAGYIIDWGNSNITTKLPLTNPAVGEISSTLAATLTDIEATLKKDDGTLVATSNKYTVTVNKKPEVSFEKAPYEVCSGSSVALKAKPDGGTYKWTSGSSATTIGTAQTLNQTLTAKTSYTVEVTVGGCSDKATTEVAVNPLPTINSLVTDDGKTDVCDGVNIGLTATASGGTGSVYTYTWSGGATGSANKTSITNIAAGKHTYGVKVKDSKQCASTTEQKIEVIAHKVVVAPVNADVCNGEAKTLQANASFNPSDSRGEVTYLWTGDDIASGANAADMTTKVLNVVEVKTYHIKVEDGNGCSAEKDVTLTVKKCTDPKIVVTGTEFCEGKTGQTVKAVISGVGPDFPTGYTIEWGDSKIVTSGTLSANTTGNVSDGLVSSINSIQATLKKGASVIATSGSYSVIVNPIPTIVSLVEDDAKVNVCDGTSVNLTAIGNGGTGALSYIWTGGPTGTANKVSVAVPAGKQTYTVKVRDQKMCESTGTKTLDVTGHKVVVAPLNKEVCVGLTAELSANETCTPDDSKGNVTYTWTGNNIASGATAATMKTSALNTIGAEPYTIKVEDGHGCSDQKTVNVTVKECGTDLIVESSTQDVTDCINRPINLSVTAKGGPSTDYRYEWRPQAGLILNGVNTPNVTVTAAVAGVYFVDVDVISEPQRKTLQMKVTVTNCGTDLIVESSTQDVVGCINQPINLSVTAKGGPSTDYRYEWRPQAGLILNGVNTPNVTVTAAAAGVYFVDVDVVSEPQRKTLQMKVTVTECGEVALLMVVDKKCANVGEKLTITLNASGADTYSFTLRNQFNTPVKTVTNDVASTWTQPVLPAEAGVYTVTDFEYVKNGIRKSGVVPAPVTAIFDPLPNVSAAAMATIANCQGDMLVLQATGNAQTYSWDKGVVDGVAFPPTAGVYTVTGESAQGCKNTSSVTVTVNPKPTINMPLDSEICLGTEVSLTATSTSPGATFTWNNGVVNGMPFKPQITTAYEATATIPTTGCFTKGLVNVIVNQPPTIVHTSKNPRNIAIGKDVYFALKATGKNLSYQWKRKVGTVWMNMADGGSVLPVIVGAQTDSLRLKGVPKEWDGSEFRCVIKGNCGSDSTEFQLAVKECFAINVELVMADGIMPDENPGNKIDGWYCIGRKIALRAIITSEEGYEIENSHFKWSVDGLEFTEEHVGANADTAVLTWIPEYQEDDMVIKVCAYSDGACEEICPKYLRLKARKFEDASFKILSSVDPSHKFCPGDTVNFWLASKNTGTSPKYTWYNDIFELPHQKSPKNELIHYENEKVTMVMGQEDTWMRVIMTPSPEICISQPVLVDTVFMMKKPIVTPSLRIECADTLACRGDEIYMKAIYENAGAKPSFQWQRSIGEPFPDWNLGTETYATVKLDEDDVWVKCVMKPSEDVCYDETKPLVDAIKIRVFQSEAKVTIACDMEHKEPGDELVFTSQVGNILGEYKYEWMMNGMLIPVDDEEYVTSTLRQGDVVYCMVSGEKVCQTRVRSNEITVHFGKISRDTVITINRNDRVLNLSMFKPGDEGKLFMVKEHAHDGKAVLTLLDGLFSYTPDRDFVGVDYIRYIVKDKSNQNKEEEGYIYIKVLENGLDNLPNIITPNGDGLNDEWHLETITNEYKEYTITVYNRTGNVVFYCKNNYANDWNGQTLNNANYHMPQANLPTGIYTYLIELGKGKKIMSWLEIRADLNRSSYR